MISAILKCETQHFYVYGSIAETFFATAIKITERDEEEWEAVLAV